MTLSDRIAAAKRHCQFCERTPEYPALVCDDCLRRRFFTEPEPREPFVPEWRRRSLAKDMTGWRDAA